MSSTTTVTFSHAHGAPVWSGETSDVVIDDAAYGQVWIWAPPTIRQAPDRLVLTGRSPSADPGDQPTYQRARDIQEADGERCPYPLKFDPDENDVGPGLDGEAASALVYTLVHYPGGGDEHGVTLFEDRDAEHVFKSDGTDDTTTANLIAVHAYPSDEVRVTSGAADKLALAWSDLKLDVPHGAAGDPLGLSFLAPSVPVTTVANPDRAWRARVLPKDTLGVPEESRAAIDAADTWLYVTRRKRVDETTVEGAFEASHIGAWKVEDDGRYQFHAYADDAAPEDKPSPVGTPGDFVLTAGTFVDDRETSLYAHLAPFPLAADRLATLLDGLTLEEDPGLTPLGFDSDTSKTKEDDDVLPYVLHTSHARWVSDERVWRWFLPDPLRVTARLSAQARIAAQQYGSWVEAAGPALQNAGLLTAVCFDPAHSRSHLTERLGRTSGFDMKTAWFARESGGAAPPTTSKTLDHFRYGVSRQGLYLQRRARVAGHRLEAWLATAHVHGLAFDLVARSLGEDPDAELDAETEALSEVVFDGLLAAVQAGAGGRLIAWALEEVRPGLASFADLEAALDALPSPEDATFADRLSGTTFKGIWTLTRRAVKLRVKLFAFTASTTAGYGWLSAGTDVRLSGNDAVAKATALFAEKIFVGDDVERGQTMFGLRTETRGWAAVGGDVETFTAGPIRLERKGHAVQNRRTPLIDRDRWEVTYRTTVRIDYWQGADSLLSLMNAGVLAVGVSAAVQDGEFGAQQAVNSAKVLVEAGKLVEMIGTASNRPTPAFGVLLKRAAPGLDVAGGVLSFVAEAQDTRREGVQRYADPDEVGMAASACLIVGGLLGVGAAIAAGPAVVVLSVLGVVTQAAAAVLLWRREVQVLAERLGKDPLTPWLTSSSMWGTGGEVPSGVLELARPGWDKQQSVPVAESLFLGDLRSGISEGERARLQEALSEKRERGDAVDSGQTGALIRTAYTFPIRVRVDDRGEVPRVALVVVPEYVPEAGTIVISAEITRPGQDSVPVKCAVHYAAMEGVSFAYTVRRVDQPLAANADPRALASSWAPSFAVEGRGSAHGLAVFLGDAWPPLPERLRAAATDGLVAAARARIAGEAGRAPRSLEVIVEELGRESGGRLSGSELLARAREIARAEAGELPRSAEVVVVEVSEELDAYRAAVGLGEAVVGPGTTLAVDGLDDALGGGFEVAGFAVFDPAAPFRPAPTVPDVRPGPEELVALEEVHGEDGFTYPRDIR